MANIISGGRIQFFDGDNCIAEANEYTLKTVADAWQSRGVLWEVTVDRMESTTQAFMDWVRSRSKVFSVKMEGPDWMASGDVICSSSSLRTPMIPSASWVFLGVGKLSIQGKPRQIPNVYDSAVLEYTPLPRLSMEETMRFGSATLSAYAERKPKTRVPDPPIEDKPDPMERLLNPAQRKFDFDLLKRT